MRAVACFVSLATVFAAAGCDENTPPPRPKAPATQPATRPATAPSTKAAAEPEPLARYTDILLDEQPDFPTTQPFSYPLDLEEAARIVFDEPIFLDAVGCLWLQHPRGQTPQQVLEDDLNRQTYVINEPVYFTWWKPGHDGRPTVELILRRADGGFDWLHETGRAAIPAPPDGRGFNWDRAFIYYRSIVVPTTGGVAVLTPEGRPDPGEYFRRRPRSLTSRPDGSGTVTIDHIALADPDEKLPATQIRADGRGLIAWVPWTSKGKPGGFQIGRYLDNAWSPLVGGGWTDRPVHLMPLSDGSILQLAMDEHGDARLSAVPLNVMPVDHAAVAELVGLLSDADSTQREAAFVALANYGPGAWPVLEELLPDQPPPVKKQLEALLGDKNQPTFGGLLPEPGPVEVREWLGDGGVILRYRNGMLLPDSAGVTILERPAWLLIRPGKRTHLLDPMLAAELAADNDTHVYVWGEEWIVSRPGESPKRWLVNHFAPLLEEEHAQWQRFVGLDQAGRWLFRLPGQETPTLLVDTRIPSPEPRLPTWLIEAGPTGDAGWDAEGWPVTKSGGAWRLKEEAWEPLEEAESFETELAADPDAPLAVAPDGTTYRGGIDRLEIALPGGEKIDWSLPPEATGSGTPRAVVDREGRLFLFNRPGRVVRLAPTPEGPEPMKVEASFEEGLPGASPRRVWLDPAGRICAVYFGTSVAIMWPDGQVPAAIRQKMPSKRREEPMEQVDRI